ncbi:MAG: rhomboid family intramembrane serine protease [Nocardioides sp.]|nr:rhomboid family intramembrane serine protease [Nocardioides sp.]
MSASAGDDVTVGVPVCPRHPDRESYVRCQRCQRPVCPQCQRQAAVGVQCVDCAAAGTAQVRSARTVFGGRARQGEQPYVTYVVMGISVVVNLLQRVPGLEVTNQFAFAPALAADEPWRYLTAAFLHATGGTFGIMHILLNMYALFLLGPYLEHVFGRARFAALYLLSAFGGSVAFELLTPDVNAFGQYTSAVGASGAVFGLFGAMFVAQRKLRMPMQSIVGVLGINLVLGFIVPGIAWQAHLGGLLVGAAATAVLAYAPRAKRAPVQWGGLAALTLLLVVLAVAGLAR